MIGILGGTFDPIHSGHLHVAKQVLDRIALDEVHFLPCAIPVHRGVPLESVRDRVSMIELAIAYHDKFKLNTLELDRGGKSYMVDTLIENGAIDSEPIICLILGVDAFNRFGRWKSPIAILQMAHLIVCQRPGISLDRTIFPHYWVESVADLSASNAGGILPLEIDESPCSSTRVRDSLKAQEADIHCLDPAVYKYIQENQLYR